MNQAVGKLFARVTRSFGAWPMFPPLDDKPAEKFSSYVLQGLRFARFADSLRFAALAHPNLVKTKL